MNWNKQMEEMVGAWTEMQKAMWDGWLQAVKGFGGEAIKEDVGWQREYRKNLELWEQSVHQALEAQQHWARSWAEQLGGGNGAESEAALSWLQQVQEMMKGWTDAQAQLWNAWFDSIKQLDAKEMAALWEREGQQVLQAWQEAAQRARDTLSEWSGMSVAKEPEPQTGNSGESEKPRRARARKK